MKKREIELSWCARKQSKLLYYGIILLGDINCYKKNTCIVFVPIGYVQFNIFMISLVMCISYLNQNPNPILTCIKIIISAISIHLHKLNVILGYLMEHVFCRCIALNNRRKKFSNRPIFFLTLTYVRCKKNPNVCQSLRNIIILWFCRKVIKICPSSQNTLRWFSGFALRFEWECLSVFYMTIWVSCHFQFRPFRSDIIWKYVGFFILLIFFSTSVFHEWNYFASCFLLLRRFNEAYARIYCIILVENSTSKPISFYKQLFCPSLSYLRAQLVFFPREIRFMASEFD